MLHSVQAALQCQGIWSAVNWPAFLGQLQAASAVRLHDTQLELLPRTGVSAAELAEAVRTVRHRVRRDERGRQVVALPSAASDPLHPLAPLARELQRLWAQTPQRPLPPGHEGWTCFDYGTHHVPHPVQDATDVSAIHAQERDAVERQEALDNGLYGSIAGGEPCSDIERWVHLGADVRGRGYESTPLHYACHADRADIVHLLMSHGADFRQVNAEGLSPLNFAEAVPALQAKEALRAWGAHQAPPRRDRGSTLSRSQTQLALDDLVFAGPGDAQQSALAMSR